MTSHINYSAYLTTTPFISQHWMNIW